MRICAVRFVLALVLLPLAAWGQDEEVTVKLPSASITGNLVTNARGESVQVFRGIRYAEAPIGANRWKPTTLIKPTGTINATVFGNTCYTDRRYDTVPKYTESEDCLFLNVYAPAGASAKSNLPVMVWTHGGFFVSGNGNQYDGRNIVGAAGNNVIYVSFNYRLGIMGFLSNDKQLEEGVGANFAVRDMTLALQWVKDNILNFGGNPDDVTVFGVSAGARMVLLQMVTNGGKQKLFNKAILESGAYPSFSYQLTKTQQNQLVSTVANKAGCGSTANVMQCLRGVNATTLMEAGGNIDWRPTVDGKVFVKSPSALAREGTISKIPTIFGTNTDEGYAFATTITTNEAVTEYLRNFTVLNEVDLKILDVLYPASAFATPTFRAGEIIADLVYVCPSEMTSSIMTLFAPTYHYRFNNTSPYANTGLQLVLHASEVPYVFNSATGLNQTLVDNMQKFWTNFVRWGSPNIQDNKAAVWPRYDLLRKQQIVLQPTLSVEKNGAYMPGHAQRCAFWATIESRYTVANN
uniref:Carboxylic ester hydrolase n=1 Tax=Globisporangium ultimum (strain ATCC 200006 / CBS 805.95 / DAOM BR144) TaxID=431595 RepID=K3WEX4_GLOUD